MIRSVSLVAINYCSFIKLLFDCAGRNINNSHPNFNVRDNKRSALLLVFSKIHT